MKILVKKVFCSACHRLVRGKEQKSNGNMDINCSICGKLIRVWNKLNWRTVG
jgi:RNase P subunit RPR2